MTVFTIVVLAVIAVMQIAAVVACVWIMTHRMEGMQDWFKSTVELFMTREHRAKIRVQEAARQALEAEGKPASRQPIAPEATFAGGGNRRMRSQGQ